MKILIAAGSSGGHIFPAIATAFKLKELNSRNEVFFIGTKKPLDVEILKNEGYGYATISSNRRIISDVFRSLSILKRFKPDIAVGFGGYVSVPALAAAKILGITTFIHEQNLMPGLANRLLSNITDAVGITFKETRNFFPKKSRVKETGNPIRINLTRLKKPEALGLFGLDEQRFTILIMGGSQGAHFINDVVLEAFKYLSPSERAWFQFIHLSGVKDFEFVRSAYEALGVKGRVFSFCDRMSQAYSAADLVISRAGASTISELAVFGLASILIPYPNLKVHQVDNAKFMERRGAALVIEQADLAPSYLKEIMLNLMRDRQRLIALSENASLLAHPDAAGRLAEEIIKNAG